MINNNISANQAFGHACLYNKFDVFSEVELELIASKLNVVKYKKGEIIFQQGTPPTDLVYVKTGLVKIYKESKSEKNLILKIANNDTFIGLLSVFGHAEHQYSAAAIEYSEICILEISIVKELLKNNSKFATKLLEIVSAQGLFIFERFMFYHQKQLPGRIADVILYFAEKIFKSELFYFPFTRRELAELACTTKESFIRTLTEFNNDKIIELEGKRVRIKSMKILKKLSEIG